MLDVFRKKKNIKIVMFFIAIIIIPAFVLWGVGSILSSKGKDSLAGLVFSKKVSKDAFIKEYHAVYNQAQLLYGENLNKVKNILNLEGQTWQRIILLKEAKRRAIKISDNEVVTAIQSSPIFQKDNTFSKDNYETMLKYYLGLRPQQYEAQMRDNLKIKTLIEEATKDIKVTEEEAWNKFRSEKNEFKLSYILIQPQKFLENISPTEEELIAFYDNNKESFKKPEQVNLEYLGILLKDLESEITISEEEIDNYYEEHQGELREMQNKEEPSLSDEDLKIKISEYLTQTKTRDKTQELVWEIESDVASNPNLSEIAEQFNLSSNETGFFSPWDPVPGIGWAYKITEQAFSLKEGEISNTIETKNGFYIIEVKEKKEPYIPNFNESKDAMLKKYLANKSSELAAKYSEELLSSIIAETSDNEEELGNIQLIDNLEFVKTDFITSASYIKGLGNASDILNVIDKNATKGLHSKVITTQAGYIILKIDNIREADREDFGKNKEKLKEELLIEKRNTALNSWFAQIKEESDLKVYFSLPK